MEVKLDNPNHESSVANIFASYFEKEDHVDVTFVCAGGRKVKGHKLILSIVSPFLKKLFSECGGNQDMITVLLPDVSGSGLKLFFDFMYEGTAKLSKAELEEFKVIQDMLEIRFPGVILNECLIQQPPRTRPPPLLKLDNKIQSGHRTSLPRNRNVGERQEAETAVINNDNHALENNARQPSNPVDEPFPPRRRSEDPDDDPLNIPDFYFLPTDSNHLQQETRPVSGGGTRNTSSKEHSQSGVRKRPYAHLANDTVHSVDVPSGVYSEHTEKKRTGKRNKGASFVSRTDKSASNIIGTGGIQTRQMKTRKM
ncbi:hypothetical protein Cfor_12980 [Coptotermes formosanus]|uniref:BTB domain-containing protein n=1 Tax=Coptotermes formosanus TaxID=36987 RepID=A0A6L2QD64_COPFO|nr:hypothetical protein Cfor_12980 [Coptotermes formosanus]